MLDLANLVYEFVRSQPSVKRVLVAFSGGVDSSVLLHAAARAGLSQNLLAIHVNHQLSEYANAWQQHCEQFCRDMEVAGRSYRVSVIQQGKGLEEAARRARMEVFAQCVGEGDLLLTAHHSGDQLETFFLRLARGAGVKGLSSMQKVRSFAEGQMGRPFLSVPQKVILAYANRHNLSWVEDDSNCTTRFDRNFLRLDVLPKLTERWPAFEQQVNRSIELLDDDQRLLNGYVQQDFATLNLRAERLGHSLNLSALKAFDLVKQKALVRYGLSELSYSMPSKVRLVELASVLNAATDRSPELHLGDCVLRRFKNRLYFLPTCWQQSSAILVPSDQGLKQGFDYTIVARKSLSGSLRSKPQSRGRSQTLKRLLQEYELEPWLRDSLPIVMCGDEVAAVGSLWVDEKYTSGDGDALTLSFEYQSIDRN